MGKIIEFLSNRQRAYRLTFGNDNLSAQEVLKDLENFCRVNESCFHSDPRVHAVLEGRREVFLRIRDHLHLDFESLNKKYGGPLNNE